jgi:hypothetical protein
VSEYVRGGFGDRGPRLAGPHAITKKRVASPRLQESQLSPGRGRQGEPCRGSVQRSSSHGEQITVRRSTGPSGRSPICAAMRESGYLLAFRSPVLYLWLQGLHLIRSALSFAERGEG